MKSESIRALPLVVDLDGTLTSTDTLVESIFCLLKKNPFNVFRLLLWLLQGGGRAKFKQKVAELADFSPANLPWREDFLDWLRQQHEAGRTIVLATAAHESIAEPVAHQLGIFDAVLASNSNHNLKGELKLAAIQQYLGGQFVYAGDSQADLPIWRVASAAILVGASRGLAQAARQLVTIEKEFSYPSASWRVWIKAMRVHQWVKNILIFVPLFTAFAFVNGPQFGNAVLAFIAFSLAASATYMFNDLWDLDSDRVHARKKKRPFASAAIPLIRGALVAVALLIMGAILAVKVSIAFLCMLMGYVILTTAYSWALKQYILIDVMMLAILYTFRVLAGAVATAIMVTPWLLAFSVFIFFSLALVKRCAELVSLQSVNKVGAHGRDYQVEDLVILWPLGVGASLCSVVIFGIYIATPGAVSNYSSPQALWLVGIGLLYWISRLWVKTARGEMHDDPIVYASRDFGSRFAALAMIAVTIMARFIA
ncbi:UbiA family prenyltransferase [Paucibacter sp. AS339]|uniref:UbiA family prenyltransferase n=1 Tax=Paucibacter hankyongi TaxID=3133434 RepID=UPI00309FA7F8